MKLAHWLTFASSRRNGDENFECLLALTLGESASADRISGIGMTVKTRNDTVGPRRALSNTGAASVQVCLILLKGFSV